MRAATAVSLTRVRFAAFALFIVGLIDLWTTVLLLRAGLMVEANPVMALILHAGLVPFILTKLLTLTAYVAVLEWYGRHSVTRAYKTAVMTFLLYAAIYVTSFWCLNHRCLM